MLVDTHCHLDFKEFDQDRKEVIDRATASGVRYMINVSSSLKSCRGSLDLARDNDSIFAALGMHPQDASGADDHAFSEIVSMSEKGKVVAIGEVGLDFYRQASPRKIQIPVFGRFVRLAVELQLPLVIHNRSADDEVLSVLKQEAGGSPRGVMHCFSGDKDFLERCLSMGLYVSFTCNVTFKNAAGLREVASYVPMDRLLLETDCPFLAPQAVRGKRNEPSYLRYLADELARIKETSVEEIARATTENALNLFGLPR